MPYTTVVSQFGPLPILVSMPVTAPKQLLVVAGSAFANPEVVGPGTAYPGGHPMMMEIVVDALPVGICYLFANLSATHLAFVPAFIPLELEPTSSPFALTLRLTHPAVFSTDGSDRFEVLLIE